MGERTNALIIASLHKLTKSYLLLTKKEKKKDSRHNKPAALEMQEGQCKFQHVVSFTYFFFFRSEKSLGILNCITKEAFSLGRKPFYSFQLAFGYISLFEQKKIEFIILDEKFLICCHL